MPTNKYSAPFAEFYARYFSEWIRALAPHLPSHLERSQVAERSLLDLCCGLGIATEAFASSGWQVVGLDLSAPMLAGAEARLATWIATGSVTLLEGDARTFQLDQPVGACICLDGALNHLESTEELARCFRAVADALHDDGQFIFDLLEPSHLRHWHHIRLIDEPDAFVAKRGVWDDTNGDGLLRISGVVGEGPQATRVEQTLRSRVFTTVEVTDALIAAGLEPTPYDIEAAGFPVRSAGCGPHAGRCRTFYRAVRHRPPSDAS